jgi:predicted nucleotidyltransferase
VTPRESLLALARTLTAELGDRKEDFVLVGGVCPALYPLLPTVSLNFTEDIDIVIRASTLAAWHRFKGELEARAFRYPSDPPGQPVCRLEKGELQLDLLTTGDYLGFTNRFYEDVFRTRTLVSAEGISLYVASPVGFVATKLEAYFGRGLGEPQPSKDLEDVLVVLRGLPSVLDELSRGDDPLAVGAHALLLRVVELHGADLVAVVQRHIESDVATQESAPVLAARIVETARARTQ